MSIFQPSLLAGKVAFVTGGGSGIGQRIAERYAEHGARVMLNGRKQDKLDAAAEKIRAAGGTAETHACDVREYGDIENAHRSARTSYGDLSTLLLCAAAGNFPAPVAGMSSNGFKSVIDIDLIGTFNTCRAAYAFLRKPGASVLSISSSHALMPIAYQAHVCAGKAGVDMLMKTLALEWGREGIRANCLTPGPTDDTEGMRRLAPNEEARRRVMSSVPLRRYGTKDELADFALFLASDAGGYLTGGVFVCDGGSSLSRSGIGNRRELSKAGDRCPRSARAASRRQPGKSEKPALLRQLGVVSATALVVSNMVGTGIFTSTGFLAGDLGAPSISPAHLGGGRDRRAVWRVLLLRTGRELPQLRRRVRLPHPRLRADLGIHDRVGFVLRRILGSDRRGGARLFRLPRLLLSGREAGECAGRVHARRIHVEDRRRANGRVLAGGRLHRAELLRRATGSASAEPAHRHQGAR